LIVAMLALAGCGRSVVDEDAPDAHVVDAGAPDAQVCAVPDADPDAEYIWMAHYFDWGVQCGYPPPPPSPNCGSNRSPHHEGPAADVGAAFCRPLSVP